MLLAPFVGFFFQTEIMKHLPMGGATNHMKKRLIIIFIKNYMKECIPMSSKKMAILTELDEILSEGRDLLSEGYKSQLDLKVNIL